MVYFLILISFISVFVGAVLFFLTRRHTYLALHEKALQTNPIYKRCLPRSYENQQRFISFSRLFLRCIGLLSVAFGGIILLAVWTVWFLLASSFRGDKFEASQWDLAGSCQGLSDMECVGKEASCPRGGMVQDLTQNYLIPETTTRGEVISLLGDYERTIGVNGQSCAAYNLGMCSGFGIDYDSLYVCFNAEDRITAIGHVQH